jgi:hypothetical protein
MVASLMVIGAAPASAAVDTSDSCPVTTPSSGFTDIGGLDATTQRAIDCLVSYGISNGTSATTYSPNGEVTRWQMALFLTRQVGVHGVSLPSGAPQGFTDIAGLNASTQVAINQLAQLDITQGTSATTFSPNDPVTRWQMALFITRLATTAGLTLPSGAPQGFGDLGGLSNEAQIAINQLAQLDIADGTSATTFDPFANVNRWQMALFLTRTLAVDGITPTAALVSIAPNDAVTLNAGQARTYTATFQNANGSVYVGAVGLRLVDVNASGAALYQDSADTTVFEATTDGLGGVASPVLTGFPGADGKVTVTVRNTAAENVRLVAWQDSTAPAGTYGAGTAPDEPFAVTAVQTFQSVAANAAAAGTYLSMDVSSTIKASNTFVAADALVNCGNGGTNPCTFAYDDNDIFEVDGSAATLAEFETALSDNDVVDITGYTTSAAGQTTWELTDNIADLTVTAPVPAGVTVDAATYTIVGKGDPGATVRVYSDPTNDLKLAGEPGQSVVATTTVSEDGAYSVSVNLLQNAANNFFVEQVVGGVIDPAGEVNVPTINESVNAAATVASTVGANGGTAGVLDPGDSVVITFSENITGVGSGDTISIVDTDGSTATLTLGPNVGFTVAANSITLDIDAVVTASGGTTGGIQTPATITAVSGFTGADGLTINVAGSPGANRTFSS